MAAFSGDAGVNVAMYAMIAAVLWGFYRLSPTLPAIALDQPIEVREAWKVTKPYSLTIFGMVVMMSLISASFDGIVDSFQHSLPLVFLAVDVFHAWVVLMTGISVLTSIYGVAVENREL